jgi:transposase
MKSEEFYESAIRYYNLDDGVNSEGKINNINIIFGISRTSFFRHLKDHNEMVIKQPNSRKSKYTNDILNYIKRYVCRFKTINVNKIMLLLEENYDITISRAYVYVLLNKIGLTYKKMYIKKQPFSDEDYKSMKDIFYKKIENIGKDNIISIDETAIYLNCKNRHGWAMKGCKCIMKEADKRIYQKKYSLLMAITNKEVILYVTHEKSINGEKYLDFIKDIVNDYGNKYTLLMDNATIHRTKIFKEYANEKKLNILYNVPYNPETNPIEMIFSPIKNNVRSNNTESITAIEDSIDDYINRISNTTLEKMFTKALSK